MRKTLHARVKRTSIDFCYRYGKYYQQLAPQNINRERETSNYDDDILKNTVDKMTQHCTTTSDEIYMHKRE